MHRAAVRDDELIEATARGSSEAFATFYHRRWRSTSLQRSSPPRFPQRRASRLGASRSCRPFGIAQNKFREALTKAEVSPRVCRDLTGRSCGPPTEPRYAVRRDQVMSEPTLANLSDLLASLVSQAAR